MSKLLVVTNMYPSPNNPYYGTFIYHFCEQLREQSIKFDLHAMTKKKGKIRKIFGYFIFYFLGFVKALGNYDRVYIHYPSFSGAFVVLARKIRKFYLIVNLHGSDVIPLSRYHRVMHNFTILAIAVADRVVVPSEYFLELVSKKYGIKKDKIFVYPSGGISDRIFRRLSETEKRDFSVKIKLRTDVYYFGFVSRMNKAKGWDTFLKAVKKTHDVTPGIEYIMVGSGPDDGEVMNYILENKLENVVHRFPLSSQEELVGFYNMIDVFVFPTAAAESLGLVAIEAMACGCPVLASDYAAPKYYVIDGYNGYKFEKGNANQLTDLMLQMYKKSRSEMEYLRNGALLTAEKYKAEKITKKLKEICETKTYEGVK